MYQQITLIGNLGNDPELRHTATGTPVCSFNLAVNKKWTGQDGQAQEKTTWFRVTTWKKTAEIVAQYLTKGSQVFVIGELEDARVWTDKEGVARASLEVNGQTVKFLGGKGDHAIRAEDMEGEGTAPVAKSPATTAKKGAPAPAKKAPVEADIPF